MTKQDGKGEKMDRKPNVIYILADDMGYGDVSAFNENAGFQTPNLDEMREEGIAFTDAHASSAVCTPSRYSILTGRYNWRSRLKCGVMSGYSSPLIEEGRMTAGHLFQENGYVTAAIGKWHLGMEFKKDDTFVENEEYEVCPGVDYAGKIEKSPITNGFNYFYGISASLDMPPYIYIENDRFTHMPDHETENTGKQFWRKGPAAPDFVHEDVLPHLTEKVLDKIEEYKDRPFFIYFPMPAPHTPILPSAEFLGKSGTNEYGDFVLMCDAVAGKISDKLKELGLYENTIVIYASDNGCAPMADFKELLAAGHNPSYVFRGHKADIYEGGHRVPLIVRWPDLIPGGQRCDKLVCLSDFFATMADYLGAEIPEDAAVDSVSNLPLWKDADTPSVREDVIHQSMNGSLSIRKGKYKLEMCPGSGGWSYPAPGEETDEMPQFQLYNLETDIGEKHNVIAEHPAVAEYLKGILLNDIRRGRSTPGPDQKNDGAEIWDAVKWMESEQAGVANKV
ncbi:arylsulfatase [Anaerolentibacter hominis]|uniref:sulfatase family protein n=1 Tax=Anaerolentibacter hominis TaxID=3079009 RepID=UPI0031B84C78